jgi:hypothetical protein
MQRMTLRRRLLRSAVRVGSLATIITSESP